MGGRLLIRGGAVLTLDRALGDFDRADVLVEDGRIAQVSPDVDAGDADVIDAAGAIVLPGFVDTHRHTWQTALRGVCADWTLLDYFRGIRLNAAAVYRAPDIHAGNLAGALEGLDAGVTTILDFSHCNNSPEHADAAVAGLGESGIRAVFAYGYYAPPVAEPAFADHAARIADAARVRSAHFPADGGLVTMGVALTELGLVPFDDTRAEVASARELDVLLTAHTGTVTHPEWPGDVELMSKAGLLEAGQVHVHCNACTDRELSMLATAGATASVTPETELQMGMGRPVTGRARACGLCAGLGCDIVSNNSGDLFAQMRLALAAQRGFDNDRELAEGRMPEVMRLTARDVLEMATIEGARAMGLDGEIGSLTPGKAADLIVLRAKLPAGQPVNDPVAAVVLQGNPRDVETVLVGGRVVKRDGALAGVDESRVSAQLSDSREHLLAELDSRGGLLPPAPEGFTEAIIGAMRQNAQVA
ncbi:MAG TPA: amidohydrolase family protein [Solirubrobacteraceae bacterium]